MAWSLYLAIVLWTTLYGSGADGLVLFRVLHTACELTTRDFKVECKSLLSIVLVWDSNKIFSFLLFFLLPFIPALCAQVSKPSSCFANSNTCSISRVRQGISVFHGQWKLPGMGAYCLHVLLFSTWNVFLLPPHQDGHFPGNLSNCTEQNVDELIR